MSKLNASGSALLWSTFIGGSGLDRGFALALDADDNPVVTGPTQSFDYPTTPGAYQTSKRLDDDVFVTKLDASGSSLLYSTFVGGEFAEYSYAVVVEGATGDAVVTGNTRSYDFPTTSGAFDPTISGAGDAFVFKLSSTGSTLLWSTALGGTSGSEFNEFGYAVVLDDAGNPVVAGYSKCPDFPTTVGAYDPTHNGGADAFVVKLSASGHNLLWGTFLGADQADYAYGLALDPAGNPVVAGATYSAAFPTTPGAYAETYAGGTTDTFVAKLDATGSSLLWSTFLGGTGYEYCQVVKLDPTGRPVVSGYTTSADFPTTADAYDTSANSSNDMFVTVLEASGSALYWSTYFGGSGYETGYDLALTSERNIVVAGHTASSNFPTTTGAYDRTYGGAVDAFVVRFAQIFPESGIGPEEIPQAMRFTVEPCPSSGRVTISYAAAVSSVASIHLFDAAGRRLCSWGPVPANGTMVWDGARGLTRPLGSGAYYLRLVAEERSDTRRFVLIK